MEAASVACIDRVLATTEKILALLRQRAASPVMRESARPSRKRAHTEIDAARGRPLPSSNGIRYAIPIGRRHTKVPSDTVVICELREHASRIGVPLPAGSEIAGLSIGVAARRLLQDYVQILECAFGSDISRAPRYSNTDRLLNWMWSVPPASAPVVAAAVTAAARITAAAWSRREAVPDALDPRGRPQPFTLGAKYAVPAGRRHCKAPTITNVVSDLRAHATRIGVPLPTTVNGATVDMDSIDTYGAARCLVTHYVLALERSFGSDIGAASRTSASGGRIVYTAVDRLLNWMWSVPAASSAIVAVAAASSSSPARAPSAPRAFCPPVAAAAATSSSRAVQPPHRDGAHDRERLRARAAVKSDDDEEDGEDDQFAPRFRRTPAATGAAAGAISAVAEAAGASDTRSGDGSGILSIDDDVGDAGAADGDAAGGSGDDAPGGARGTAAASAGGDMHHVQQQWRRRPLKIDDSDDSDG